MSGIHNEQKVAVFVDVQNMYYSAKNLYGKKVNFKNILTKGLQGRRLIRALAYVIRADIPEEQSFFDALDKIGYEVKIKELKTFYGGAKKGDWDMGLAIDALNISSKVDVVIVVSGDGDFQALINDLKSKGVRVEVMAFGKSASKESKESADHFLDLDHNSSQYLI